MDLVAEKISWSVRSFQSFQYHSATSSPSLVTTRQFDWAASASAAMASSASGSSPAAAGSVVVHSGTGQAGPSSAVAVPTLVPAVSDGPAAASVAGASLL